MPDANPPRPSALVPPPIKYIRNITEVYQEVSPEACLATEGPQEDRAWGVILFHLGYFCLVSIDAVGF